MKFFQEIPQNARLIFISHTLCWSINFSSISKFSFIFTVCHVCGKASNDLWQLPKHKFVNEKIFYRILYCLVEIIGAYIYRLITTDYSALVNENPTTKNENKRSENLWSTAKEIETMQSFNRQEWHGEDENRLQNVPYLFILSYFFDNIFSFEFASLIRAPSEIQIDFFGFCTFDSSTFRIIYYVSIRIAFHCSFLH